MPIVTSIEILNMKAKKLLEGKSNVIQSISFKVNASDGVYSKQLTGTQSLTFDSNNFIEWADTTEFKDKVIEWTKPYSDELIAACVSDVTELAKEEDETLEFTE